ncbi:hypothetical protein BUE80_DR002031 [Diplocarpon rosae]|nr:hypothetical protein BUE80_DR002031 [Diplocarpon rosae]
MRTAIGTLLAVVAGVGGYCPEYSRYSQQKHEPLSAGRYQLSAMRPAPACRTFNSSVVEETIVEMQSVVKDPDLYRLFENAFPNSLDTAVRWKGFAAGDGEEEYVFVLSLLASGLFLPLASCFWPCLVVCGSQEAMWLRDSANQMQSYLTLLHASSSPDSLASLYRGVINLQARYILSAPHCNSFQPPVDDWYLCGGWVCESESLYVDAGDHDRDRDLDEFWPWESGPRRNGPDPLGLQAQRRRLFIPANMMFSRYLDAASRIMAAVGTHEDLATRMHDFSRSLRDAITTHGIVDDRTYGQVYAYEVDGFGSANRMDDANIPSLLSAPFIGYLDASDPVYQNTRRFVLSPDNPYFMRGPVINASLFEEEKSRLRNTSE